MLQINTTKEILTESIENIISDLHSSMKTTYGDIFPEQQIELENLILSLSKLITNQVNQNLEIEFSHTVKWDMGFFSVYELTYLPNKNYGEIVEYLYKEYGKDDCTLDSKIYHGDIEMGLDVIYCDKHFEVSVIELIRKFSDLPLKIIGHEN